VHKSNNNIKIILLNYVYIFNNLPHHLKEYKLFLEYIIVLKTKYCTSA